MKGGKPRRKDNGMISPVFLTRIFLYDFSIARGVSFVARIYSRALITLTVQKDCPGEI